MSLHDVTGPVQGAVRIWRRKRPYFSSNGDTGAFAAAEGHHKVSSARQQVINHTWNRIARLRQRKFDVEH